MDVPLDLLQMKNALITPIQCAALSPHYDKQVLAIVLDNNDIVLWRATTKSDEHFIKWIPWKNDENSKIRALAFEPVTNESMFSNTLRLLVLTASGSIYMLDIEKIIEGNPSHELYSQFSLQPSCPFPDFVPNTVVWWNSYHDVHEDIAVIGGANGQLIFYSLTQFYCITSMNTGSQSPIVSLSIGKNLVLRHSPSYLLVVDESKQQWKLLLEKTVDDTKVVLLSFDKYEPASKFGKKNQELILSSNKSRVQQIKQITVDTFTSLRQKLNESRKVAADDPKENIEPEIPEQESSELLPYDCNGEALISVQKYKKHEVLTALSISSGTLEIFVQDEELMTVLHHNLKFNPLVTALLITSTFIYIADIVDNQHRILVFSTRLSELKKNQTAQFNPASFIQHFVFPENEYILNLREVEVAIPFDETLNFGNFCENTNSQESVEDEWNKACLVITNVGVYIISLKANPIKSAVYSIREDMELLTRLPFIFNIYLSKIIELITDCFIKENKVNEALILSNKFECYSGRITLRLASHGFIEELLLYTENLLNQTDLDLPVFERVHLSNFVLKCYCERYLRNSPNENIKKQFLQFLKNNRFYDEEKNIRLLGNYRLCEFLHFLIVNRGLWKLGAEVFTTMIAHNVQEKLKNLHYFDGFWELFSEILLVNPFASNSREFHLHIYYFREYFQFIPNDILQKLYQLYHPMQMVLRPALQRMLDYYDNYPIEKYLESYSLERDIWPYDPNMFDLITNFIFLHINFYKNHTYDPSLTDYILELSKIPSTNNSKISNESVETCDSISTPIVSSGSAHAALVRNGFLFMWGQPLYGCLGIGPTSPQRQHCVPTFNNWFKDLDMKVIYVACGKHHTVALTENGVYTWGSSRFGQLGIGSAIQSAANPSLVETLSSSVIVNVAAGQYHSMATDIHGRLWTWGWGVYGQLGHGNVDDQYYPKCVEKLEKKFIVNVCGGQAHSIALSKNGRLYTFGCNTYGQLGIGTTAKSTIPVEVFGIQEQIVSIATNYFHNLALSNSNRLYTWGCSPHMLRLQTQSQKRARTLNALKNKRMELIADQTEGQDGLNLEFLEPSSKSVENQPVEPAPIQVDNTKHLSPILVDTSSVEGNIKQISCGLFHSALLTTSSEVYTWGRNTDGQLGNCKRQSDISVPTVVNISPTKLMSNKQQMKMFHQPLSSISCGRDYTLVVGISGLYGWGNNSYGQIGSKPKEDSSIKRFLNGKFIMSQMKAYNKKTKRMIKWSHGGINSIEKPVEFNFMKYFTYYFFGGGETEAKRYTQIARDLYLPGLIEGRYSLLDKNELTKILDDQNKILHYFLEYFHEFYNVDFLLQTCVKTGNLQAIAKICRLNNQFYDGFFYELKAFFSHIEEYYYFDSFMEVSYDDLPKKRLIAKNIKYEKNEIKTGEKYKEFKFMEEVVVEMMSLFAKYFDLTLEFKPKEIDTFLKKSISVWITYQLPMQPLEKFLLQNLEAIAYPLTVFLFCDRNTIKTSPNDSVSSVCNFDENNVRSEEQLNLPAYLQPRSLPQPISFRYAESKELRMAFRRDLYPNKNVYLESNDSKYQLTTNEILKQFSVQFISKLCSSIVENLSKNPTSNFEEFIRLLHEMVFLPSLLKSDDRKPEEILSAVVNTLRRNETPRKRFIQLSYEELCDKPIENKLIVFSCNHFYMSQSDYEKEVNSMVDKLDGLHLLNCSEFVNRLFIESNHSTCCPNCLLQYIENVVNSKTEE